MAEPVTSSLDDYLARKGNELDARTGGSLFDLYIQQGDNQQQFLGQVNQAVEINADKYAQDRQTAKVLNRPTAAVQALPEDSARQAKIQQIQKDTANAPVLKRHYTDADFAKLAHDDSGVLSSLEDVFQFLKNSGKALFSSLPTFNAGAWGLGQAGAELVAPLLDPLTGRILPENPLRRIAEGMSNLRQQQDTLAKGLMPKTNGIAEGGWYSGLQSLGLNTLTLPAAVLTGQPEIALYGLSGVTGGGAYGEARDKGVPMTQALPYATSQAAIEYATERLPVSWLIKDLKAGAPAWKTFLHQVAGEIPGEQAATFLQDLNDWAVLHPEKPFKDYLAERPSAAAQTFIATLVGAGGNVAVGKALDYVTTTQAERQQRQAQAETQKRMFELMDGLSAESKLKARDAETFGRFLEAAAPEGAENVYISVQALMQSGVAEQVAQAIPAVAEQLPEAIASDGYVRIPMADYGNVILGTPLNQSVIDHIKVDPNRETFAESKEYAASFNQEMQAAIERRMTDHEADATFKASRDAVRDQFVAELQKAKVSFSDAHVAYATMLANFYAVTAAKLGVTPEALVERYQLGVTSALRQGRAGLEQEYRAFLARTPEVQEALGKLRAGEITASEYDAVVAKYRPVTPYAAIPAPATREEMINALHANKRDTVGVPSATLKNGHEVGLRLDIPAYLDHGVWVPTIHQKGAKAGGAGPKIGHEATAVVNGARFSVSPPGAVNIASGAKTKSPIATVEGAWENASPEDVVREAEAALRDPDWVQVGMDPYRHSYFYDRTDMRPVLSADRVIQVGPLVLAKNPVYGNRQDFLFQAAVADQTDQDRLNSLSNERISPRMPTGVRATEDPNGIDRLQPDLATVMQDRKAFAKNIGLMMNYANFRGLQGTPEQMAEQMIQSMVDNLIWLHDHWQDGYRARSKMWYVGGNRIAHRWAQRFGISPQQVAAVIAATSPQKDWFQNVSLAERILEAMINNSQTAWDSKMSDLVRSRDWGGKKSKDLKYTPSKELSRFEGKTLRDLYNPADPARSLLDMAVWIRAWDEAHNPQVARVITPEGGFSNKFDSTKGGKPIALRWQSFATIAKTLEILQAKTPAEISAVVGANHKVRSFYNNIIAPLYGDDVTIDTHAVAAALLRPLSSASIEVAHNFGTGQPQKKNKKTGAVISEKIPGTANSTITGLFGTYAIYAEAYRRAAEQVGLLPREMQSITWEAVRGLFRPEQKRSGNLAARIDQIWDNVAKGETDVAAAREQISRLVSGIQDPAWIGSTPGVDETATDSSYASELSGSGVSGGRAGSVANGTGRDTAAGNQGAVLDQSGPGFYSALSRGIFALPTKSATAQGWKDAIKGLVNKGQAKADEVEWTGINDWLDLQQGKVTREQVLGYLEQGGVRVEEVVLGRDGQPNNDVWEPDDGLPGNTRYGQYVLPGGTNYREVLLTLPSRALGGDATRLAELNRLLDEKTAGYDALSEDERRSVRAEIKPLRDERTAIEAKKVNYKSRHWDQPNVLAHIRVNDRTDADGKRVLFVEEIQSDWGQEGKKKGFFDKRRLDQLDAKLKKEGRLSPEEGVEYNRMSEMESLPKTTGGVPTAPFVTKTEGWLNLALKRVITMAAEGGYDRVAFVNGEQSADRYDLSKQVDKITIGTVPSEMGKWQVVARKDGNVAVDRVVSSDEELASLIGKDLAEKAIASNGGSYSGLDLKVGGEGMKTFYDTIVPTALNKLLPKVGGGKMARVEIALPVDGTPSAGPDLDAEIDAIAREAFGDAAAPVVAAAAKALPQLGFDVTDAMREKTAGGLPLFQPSGEGPRGQIYFGNDITETPSLIAMLQNADLSTFIHESGHFFLQVQMDLAARIQARIRDGDGTVTEGERSIVEDANKLLSWFGVQGRPGATAIDEWHAMTLEQQRPHHEQFARGWEAYAFEGNAPTVEMQAIFQRFAAWLLQIYKAMTNLNVTLTDEVRGVMDRMIATREQIATAEAARNMGPLFTPQNAQDLITNWQAYHALGNDATQAGVDELQAKSLKEFQWASGARSRALKQIQKRHDELRREMRIAATRDVLNEPLYRAWTFLTGRLRPEDKLQEWTPPKSDKNEVDPRIDSLFVAIAKAGGLRRDQVESTWGWDPKEQSPMLGFGKYLLRRDGGRTLDDMAEFLGERGYLSLDENGKVDLHEFEDRFMAERRGDKQFSAFYDAAVNQQPQRAGDQFLVENLENARLDLRSLSEIGIPDQIIEHLKSLKMTAKTGLHPDIVAEMFGFSSGDELVRMLAAAPTPKERVEQVVDQRMLEAHGELATPEARERAADMAVHNEMRARMLHAEAAALERAMNVRKDSGAVDRNGRRQTYAVLPEAARAFAKRLVGRLKIRDIQPSQYAAAEAKAAREAERAFAKSDLRRAAEQKRAQILNNYATREAYRAQDEVRRAVAYLRRFEKQSKAIDPDYYDQIAQMLERFDLVPSTSLKQIDKRTALAAWLDAQKEQGIAPEIPPELAEAAYRKSYKNMTVDELIGLRDTVKQLEHLGRLKQKLLTAQDQREFNAVRDEIALSIEENSRGRRADNRTPNTVLGEKLTAIKAFGAAHIKAATWARILDGGKDGGPVWEYLIRSANAANDQEVTMREKATRELSALLAPVLAEGKMGGKGMFFPSIGMSLNKEARLAIALNIGNESNLQRLLGGEGWTVEQIKPVLDTLSTADWTFVQAVWDYFESYRPMIGAKERRVYGKEPEWIDARPLVVETRDGDTLNLRGGYYPVKYDPRASQRAGELAAAEEAERQLKGAFTSATTRRSFTKTRAEAVEGRPLLYSLDGIYSGVNEVIHDLAWHEWLIDANRLLKNPKVSDAIRTHYGVDVHRQFTDWVKDNAEGGRGAADAGEKALAWVRQGVSVSGLGLNLMSALLQPFGITQSWVRIGTQWIGRGVARTIANPAGSYREACAMSEFMRTRGLTRMRELAELRNEVKGQTKARATIDAAAYSLMLRAQQMVDVPTWWGAYEKAMADGQDEQRAIALADQAVIDSQGGGTINNLSAIERGGPWKKLFTTFYSFANTSLNLGVAQTMTAESKPKLAADYLMIYVVPVILIALMRSAFTPGDSGDWDDPMEIAEKLIKEQIAYLMGMFFGVREMAGIVDAFRGKPGGEYHGPAGLRLIPDTLTLAKQLGQGEADESLRKATVNVAAELLRLPGAQVNRTITGTQALIEGDTGNPAAVVFGYEQRR